MKSIQIHSHRVPVNRAAAIVTGKDTSYYPGLYKSEPVCDVRKLIDPYSKKGKRIRKRAREKKNKINRIKVIQQKKIKEDLSGKTFGNITILSKATKGCYLGKCSCGDVNVYDKGIKTYPLSSLKCIKCRIDDRKSKGIYSLFGWFK